MSGSAFEFSATDQSSNVFNPGPLISRALGGNINFGISGKQIVIVAGIAGAAFLGYLIASNWRRK